MSIDAFTALFCDPPADASRAGDLVSAEIVAIDQRDVECVIADGRTFRVPLDERLDPALVVGTTIEVQLFTTDQHGTLAASVRMASKRSAWERVREAHDHDAPLPSTVTRRLLGGWEVDLGGVLALLPDDTIQTAVEPGQQLAVHVLRYDRWRESVLVYQRS
jgi:small subunit ribosomal protein S1